MVANGTTTAPGFDAWTSIELTTEGRTASATVNGAPLFSATPVRNSDTGFGAIGANAWFGIEYDNLKIDQAGNDWAPASPCGAAKAGDALSARDCAPNGVQGVDDLTWELESDWLLRHVPSGLCATAAGATPGAGLALQPCDTRNMLQKFVNDYTSIRNWVNPMTLHNTSFVLHGALDGAVSIASKKSANGTWNQWVFFPNTGQLRNQYKADTIDRNSGARVLGQLGYPMCLSACPP
jgi:hypothetical protein